MLKFLSATVTQGSADAFATTSVATGLANASLGYKVRGITYQCPAFVETDCDFQLQVVRRVPTAIVAITDRTLVHALDFNLIITTSGQQIYPRLREFWFDDNLDLLLVEDPIYFSIDSSGTSATNAARVRIYYEEVRLSETAKLAALTESLNA